MAARLTSFGSLGIETINGARGSPLMDCTLDITLSFASFYRKVLEKTNLYALRRHEQKKKKSVILSFQCFNEFIIYTYDYNNFQGYARIESYIL